MTQKEKVLKYLKSHKNGLTVLTATKDLYILNVRQVIHDLREQGYNIETVKKKSKNAIYGSYILHD